MVCFFFFRAGHGAILDIFLRFLETILWVLNQEKTSVALVVGVFFSGFCVFLAVLRTSVSAFGGFLDSQMVLIMRCGVTRECSAGSLNSLGCLVRGRLAKGFNTEGT